MQGRVEGLYQERSMQDTCKVADRALATGPGCHGQYAKRKPVGEGTSRAAPGRWQ